MPDAAPTDILSTFAEASKKAPASGAPADILSTFEAAKGPVTLAPAAPNKLMGDEAADAVLAGTADPKMVDRESMLAAMAPRQFKMNDEQKSRVIKFLDDQDKATPDERSAWEKTKAVFGGLGEFAAGVAKTPYRAYQAVSSNIDASGLVKDNQAKLLALADPELDRADTPEHSAGLVLERLKKKVSQGGEDSLTPQEKELLPVVKADLHAEAMNEAAQQGVGEGLTGIAQMTQKAIARNLMTDSARLQQETGIAADKQLEAKALAGDETAQAAKEDIAHAASIADPGMLATGELAGRAGGAVLKAATPAASKLATAIGEGAEKIATSSAARRVAAEGVGAAPVSATGIVRGAADTAAAFSHGMGRGVSKLLNYAAGTGAAGAAGLTELAERMASRYSDAATKVGAEALGFGGLAEAAGEDPYSSAAGVLAGHLTFNAAGRMLKGAKESIKAKSLQPLGAAAIAPAADFAATALQKTEGDYARRGAGDIRPTGDAKLDEAANNAYHSAAPEDRRLISQGRAAVDNFNAAAAKDPSSNFVNSIVVKTPEEALAVRDKIRELTGAEVDFDPSKNAGFTTEALPADAFGNPALAGRNMKVSVSFTDSPLFRDAFAEELGHGVWETLPKELRDDVAGLMSPDDAAALVEQGVPNTPEALSQEFGAQQLAQYFKSRNFAKEGGARQRVVSFLESVAGGKASDTVGTRGLLRDRASQGLFAKAARDTTNPLSDFNADVARGTQPTRFGPTSGAPTPAYRELISREAASFNRDLPEQSIGAKAARAATPGTKPEDIRALVRSQAELGDIRLSGTREQAAADRARELLGFTSEGEAKAEIRSAAEKAKADRAAEVEARADARLEATGQRKLVTNELANARFEGRPADLSSVKWDNFSPEERTAIEDKASRLNKGMQQEREARFAKMEEDYQKQVAKTQAGLDKQAAAEEQRRYDAYWNELKRSAADEAARQKVEAAYRKESAARAKAAEEAASTPSDQKGLDAAFAGMKPSQRAQMVAKGANTLAENFKTVLASERTPIIESLRASVKELPAESGARRAALLELAQQARDTLMADQGKTILDSATTFRHPEGMTEPQWKAVAESRGKFVLGAEADALVHSILRRLLGDKSSAVEIDAAVKSSRAPRDEAFASRKDSEIESSTDDYTPAAETSENPVPKTILPAAPATAADTSGGFKVPSQADVLRTGAAPVVSVPVFSSTARVESGPYSKEVQSLRDAVADRRARASGVSKSEAKAEMNRTLTNPEMLAEAASYPDLKARAEKALASGEAKERIIAINGMMDDGNVAGTDINQFTDSLNALRQRPENPGLVNEGTWESVRDHTNGMLGKILGQQFDSKLPLTPEQGLVVYNEFAKAYSKGKSMSGMRLNDTGAAPSVADFGVSDFSRLDSFLVSAALGGNWAGGGSEMSGLVKSSTEAAKRITEGIRAADKAHEGEYGDLSAGPEWFTSAESPQQLASDYRLGNSFRKLNAASFRDAKPLAGGSITPAADTSKSRLFHAGNIKAKAAEAGTFAGALGATSVRAKEENKRDLSDIKRK